YQEEDQPRDRAGSLAPFGQRAGRAHCPAEGGNRQAGSRHFAQAGLARRCRSVLQAIGTVLLVMKNVKLLLGSGSAVSACLATIFCRNRGNELTLVNELGQS